MLTFLRLVALLGFLVLAPAFAHHSMDLQGAPHVEIRGRIVKASWDGAHVVYVLQSQSDTDGPTTWTVMGASPKILRTRGISKNQLQPGETVVVVGRFDSKTNVIAPDYLITDAGKRFALGYYPPSM